MCWVHLFWAFVSGPIYRVATNSIPYYVSWFSEVCEFLNNKQRWNIIVVEFILVVSRNVATIYIYICIYWCKQTSSARKWCEKKGWENADLSTIVITIVLGKEQDHSNAEPKTSKTLCLFLSLLILPDVWETLVAEKGRVGHVSECGC